MNGFMKFIIAIIAIAYFISPVDFAIGPIDDIIVLMLAAASQEKLADN